MENKTAVNFLVVSKNKGLREILNFYIECQINSVVSNLETPVEALTYLKKITEFPHVIIYDYESESYLIEDFITYLRLSAKPVHIIILCDQASDEGKGLFKTLKYFYLSGLETALTDIFTITTTVFKYLDPENRDPYRKVPINVLQHIDGLSNDLYIKLPSGKTIKLFAQEDKIESLDFEKYKERGVEHLYITDVTWTWILKQLMDQFQILLKNKSFKFILRSPEEHPEKQFEQKIIRIQDDLHIDKEFKESIQKVIDKTIGILKTNPKVGAMIKSITDDKENSSYFSKKIRLMSLVSTYLAKELEWNSQTTIDKLIYASFIHDITISHRTDLLKIKSGRNLQKSLDKLSREDRELYLSHSSDAHILLKNSFSSAPTETDMLILQHHELPDGSGFPQKLKWDKIPPLSCLFIISHDFCQYVLEEDDPKLEEYLLTADAKFQKSTFRKIISKLKMIEHK